MNKLEDNDRNLFFLFVVLGPTPKLAVYLYFNILSKFIIDCCYMRKINIFVLVQ